MTEMEVAKAGLHHQYHPGKTNGDCAGPPPAHPLAEYRDRQKGNEDRSEEDEGVGLGKRNCGECENAANTGDGPADGAEHDALGVMHSEDVAPALLTWP